MRQFVDPVARQMAKDVDLDWDRIKPEWQDDYRRRAENVLALISAGSWLAPWEANEVVDRWLIPEDWEKLRDALLAKVGVK